VVAQNRRTIFKLVTEAVFGRKARRISAPEGDVSHAGAAPPGAAGERVEVTL
jgi:hypothetical protein